MSLTLPPPLASFVHSQVQSGAAPSEADFIISILALYQKAHTDHDTLKRDLAAARAELERGEGIPFELAGLQAELQQRRRRSTPS